jgi:antitoxin Phd
MNINTNSLISITEANQDFAKVTRIVDETGSAIILKNNSPRYLVIDFHQTEQERQIPDDDIFSVSKRFLEQNLEAYKELAK